MAAEPTGWGAVGEKIRSEAWAGWNKLSLIPVGVGAFLALIKLASWGLVLILASAIYVLVRVLVRYQHDIDASPRPALRFDYISNGDVGFYAGDHTGAKAMLPVNGQAARLHVVNEPRGYHTAAIAQAAWCRVLFFHGDDLTPILDMKAKWTENDQLVNRPLGTPVADIYRLNLEPNGENHGLDIAIRIKGEQHMYAANNDFWRTGGRDARCRLTEDEYRIQVTVKANNLAGDLALVGSFRLSNLASPDSKGRDMLLEPLDDGVRLDGQSIVRT